MVTTNRAEMPEDRAAIEVKSSVANTDIAMALHSYAVEVLADRYAANLALFERTLTEER
jgi:hypothetical protein